MIYFLTDLDNTLFQSSNQNVPISDLITAAVSRDGYPLSFCRKKQCELIKLMMTQGTVIPVTGRNYDSFSRVKLSFSDHLAILNFGGIILNRLGEIDYDYRSIMSKYLIPFRPKLENIFIKTKELIQHYDLTIVPKIISDDGLSFYIQFKTKPIEIIETSYHDYDILYNELLRDSLNTGDFYLYRNGKQFALLPCQVNKKSAVYFLIDHYLNDATLLFGLGDSMDDFGFMSLCDYALFPTNSQMEYCLRQASKKMEIL